MLQRQLLAVRGPAFRRFATSAGGGDYFAQLAATRAHAAETTELWRKVSFFVALPVCLLTVGWVLKVEGEHAEHVEHIKHEHGGHLPEVPAYPYMNKRAKPFPWGMNSLFFNPHANKDMSNA